LDTKNANKNTNLYIVHPHTHTHTLDSLMLMQWVQYTRQEVHLTYHNTYTDHFLSLKMSDTTHKVVMCRMV